MALIHIDKVIVESNDEKLDLIIKKLEEMGKTQAQIAQELRDMKVQNEKARQEMLAKLATLEEAVANAGNSTPEVDEAIADLKSSIQADDDLNPDAEAPAGEVEETTDEEPQP